MISTAIVALKLQLMSPRPQVTKQWTCAAMLLTPRPARICSIQSRPALTGVVSNSRWRFVFGVAPLFLMIMRSCGEVKRLVGCGLVEGLPAIDAAHGDLPRGLRHPAASLGGPYGPQEPRGQAPHPAKPAHLCAATWPVFTPPLTPGIWVRRGFHTTWVIIRHPADHPQTPVHGAEAGSP